MKTLLALILLAFHAAAQNPAPPDEASTAIGTLRDGLVSTFTKGDIEGLLGYLDNEVIVTWQNGEVCRGKDAVRAFYNRMMTGEKRIVREIKSAPEVTGRQVNGDWAVSWGNLRDHFILNDGSDLPFNSAFTATIAKRGDRWLVTAFHASVNVFDNAVLSIAAKKIALWTGIIAVVVGVLIGWLIGRWKRA